MFQIMSRIVTTAYPIDKKTMRVSFIRVKAINYDVVIEIITMYIITYRPVLPAELHKLSWKWDRSGSMRSQDMGRLQLLRFTALFMSSVDLKYRWGLLCLSQSLNHTNMHHMCSAFIPVSELRGTQARCKHWNFGRAQLFLLMLSCLSVLWCVQDEIAFVACIFWTAIIEI